MRNLILMFAMFICTFVGYSQQEKGTTQISALQISATSANIDISSPSITHYCFDNIGFSLGVANYDDISVGIRYYAKENNFIYTDYNTSSESINIGVGRTYDWGKHVQIEPRLTVSNALDDARSIGLGVHLNLLF
jgi:hypothetical protein